MSFETVVMFGNDEREWVKDGSDAMELGEGIAWGRVWVRLEVVVVVDMVEEEDDRLQDMGVFRFRPGKDML